MHHRLLGSKGPPLCYLLMKRGQIKIDSIGFLSSRAEFLRLNSIPGHAAGWLMCGRLSYMTARN